MRIAMFTNTYLPLVGGASISIARFAERFRAWGHRVLVVAPEFEGQPASEQDVVRIPALKHVNDTRFSLPLPLHFDLGEALDAFAPELVHTHHPFLLGDTALRTAAMLQIPIVVTHHTHHKQYAHYVPGDIAWVKEFVNELCIHHANLCNAVIAPSETIRRELEAAGVTQPIEVIPTGLDLKRYQGRSAESARERLAVARDAFLIGHVGRLAPEKNLAFLATVLCRALDRMEDAHCLIVGDGPVRKEIEDVFTAAGYADRTHFTGLLQDGDLLDAYAAMDLFVFASKSETQGMVIAEAIAADTPVVVLQAQAVGDVVQDKVNGRLVAEEDEDRFVDAMAWVRENHDALRRPLHETIEDFTLDRCARELLEVYDRLQAEEARHADLETSEWGILLRRLQVEWKIWAGRLESAGSSIWKA